MYKVINRVQKGIFLWYKVSVSSLTGADLSDTERELPSSASPAPVSYAQHNATPPPVQVVDPTADTLVSSTETLLRNIQGLLKVAADNARQQERQISYEKGKCILFYILVTAFQFIAQPPALMYHT